MRISARFVRTLMKSCPSSVFNFSIMKFVSHDETMPSQENSEEGRSRNTQYDAGRTRHFVGT